jgi:hypothetical protein
MRQQGKNGDVDHAAGQLGRDLRPEEGLDDDAGGRHIEDEGGHLPCPAGFQPARFRRQPAGTHQNKQDGDLFGHQDRVLEQTAILPCLEVL